MPFAPQHDLGRATDDCDLKVPLADFMSAAQSLDGLWSSSVVLEDERVPLLGGKDLLKAEQGDHVRKQARENLSAAAARAWDCSRCTFRNEKHFNFCEVCMSENATKHEKDAKTAHSVRRAPSSMLSPLLRMVPAMPLVSLAPTILPALWAPWDCQVSQHVPCETTGGFSFGTTSASGTSDSQTPLFKSRWRRARHGRSGSTERVWCGVCRSERSGSKFSVRQRKKRAEERKCRECVQKLQAIRGKKFGETLPAPRRFAAEHTETGGSTFSDARYSSSLAPPKVLGAFTSSAASIFSPSLVPASAPVPLTPQKTIVDLTGARLREIVNLTATSPKKQRVLSPVVATPIIRSGDLTFVKQIGVGGYGKVMAARHKGRDKMLAVKILYFRKEPSEENPAEAKASEYSGTDKERKSPGERSSRASSSEDTLGVARDNTVEEEILGKVSHPFISNLLGCFREEKRKLLVFELASGDLYHKLTAAPNGRFPRSLTVFYAAQLVLALEYLHSRGVIHKDVKLDNILLGHDGYVRLTDFGSATRVDASSGFCIAPRDCFIGTVMFSAPELVRESFFYYAPYCDKALIHNLSKESMKGDQRCSFPVDFWSFGTAVFEMLTGKSPFDHCDDGDEKTRELTVTEPEGGPESELKPESEAKSESEAKLESEKVPADAAEFLKQGKDVLNVNYSCPEDMDTEATDFIRRLLQRNPNKRLGANGADEVKKHPFFKNIDWDMLMRKRVKPPTESSLAQSSCAIS